MASIPEYINLKLEIIDDKDSFKYRVVEEKDYTDVIPFNSVSKQLEQKFIKSLSDEQLGNMMMLLTKELKNRHSERLQEYYYAYVEHPDFRCDYNCRRDNNNGVWQSEGYLDKEEYYRLFNDPKTVTLNKIEKDYIVCVTEKFNV